ncbi:MAG TPA: 4Fe-4S binding protein [Spirochaetota bacterium]|nr:4Fe-4S binding protein [Spirochaetota bacterium]
MDKALCTGCGICADRCVRNAITIGGTAIIDTNICTGCGKCVDACPAGALVLR